MEAQEYLNHIQKKAKDNKIFLTFCKKKSDKLKIFRNEILEMIEKNVIPMPVQVTFFNDLLEINLSYAAYYGFYQRNKNKKGDLKKESIKIVTEEETLSSEIDRVEDAIKNQDVIITQASKYTEEELQMLEELKSNENIKAFELNHKINNERGMKK